MDSENIEKKMLHITVGTDVVISVNCGAGEIKFQIFDLMPKSSEIDCDERHNIIHNDSFFMDYSMRKVLWMNRELRFTKHEFDFLYLLSSTPERVYTFSRIYQVVWGDYPQGDIINMICCMVKRIKKKMKALDSNIPDMIHNVRNIGYFFKLNTDV